MIGSGLAELLSPRSDNQSWETSRYGALTFLNSLHLLQACEAGAVLQSSSVAFFFSSAN